MIEEGGYVRPGPDSRVQLQNAASAEAVPPLVANPFNFLLDQPPSSLETQRHSEAQLPLSDRRRSLDSREVYSASSGASGAASPSPMHNSAVLPAGVPLLFSRLNPGEHSPELEWSSLEFYQVLTTRLKHL